MTFKAVCKYSVCEVSCLGFGLDFLVRLSAPMGLAGFSERRGTKNQLFSLLPGEHYSSHNWLHRFLWWKHGLWSQTNLDSNPGYTIPCSFIFLDFKITVDGDSSHEIKTLLLLGCFESYDKCRQRIKKQRHHFDNKGTYTQSYGFSSSHVQMWEFGA